MTARYDKISTLPKGNNEYFYPSVSGSLLLNQLFNFPSGLIWQNCGSYASVTSGKIADDNYGYISAFDKRVGWNGQSAFAFGNILIDQNIKPQTTDSWEIGTNLVFLRNRINLDVAYFNARDYNQLERVPLSEDRDINFSRQTEMFIKEKV